MDGKKPNQISIKLNGSNLALKPERPQNHVTTAATGVMTVSKTRSVEPVEADNPVDTEEDALMRLNQLREQGAAAKFKPDSTFVQDGPIIEWEDEQATENASWSSRLAGFLLRQRSGAFPPFTRAPWFKMMASTFGAISLGLVFGFAVLMIFKEEQLSQSYKTVLGETLQIPTNPGQVVGKAADETGKLGKPGVSQAESPAQPLEAQPTVQTVLSVPEQRFFLAQAGVFQDIASAQSVIDPLTRQGYPHFFYEVDGKQHLFVAMAASRDEILGLANQFKNNQMDVYIKEVTFPAVEKEVQLPQTFVNSDSAKPDQNRVESFFQSGFELARALLLYSTPVLNQESGSSPVSTEEETKLRDLHRKFVDEGRVVQGSVPAEWQPLMKNMIDGLNQAVEATSGLATANSQSYAWQVQNGLFQYVSNYVEWTKK